jgi:hypothetical protein
MRFSAPQRNEAKIERDLLTRAKSDRFSRFERGPNAVLAWLSRTGSGNARPSPKLLELGWPALFRCWAAWRRQTIQASLVNTAFDAPAR